MDGVLFATPRRNTVMPRKKEETLRNCLSCGAVLSRYNPGSSCFCHSNKVSDMYPRLKSRGAEVTVPDEVVDTAISYQHKQKPGELKEHELVARII